MKIGFVLDDTLDTADGIQQYILLLGSWLTDHGHDVHYLVATSRRNDRPNIRSLARQFRVKFNRNVVPLALPTSARKIASVLDWEKFDVLHIQLPYNPAFGARVVGLCPPGTALIGTFHIMPYAKTEEFLTKVLGYWLKPTLGRFDQVISVSPPAQQFARQTLKLESVVVPNMVDIKEFKLVEKKPDNQVPHLVFIGRLVERKGCHHFLRALALLDRPFKVTIIGDGSQRSKLQRLAEKLRLNEKLEFVGFVSESRKRQVLSQADIAVFPSTGGESFGIVLIEAMSAGSCVVLAGNNPGYSSVMSKAPDSLFDPTDHQGFAAKISEVINNPSVADKLYKQQQKLVKQFDVGVVSKQIVNIYQKAIDKRTEKQHTSQ